MHGSALRRPDALHHRTAAPLPSPHEPQSFCRRDRRTGRTRRNYTGCNDLPHGQTTAVTTEMNLQQPAAATPEVWPSDKGCRVHLVVALRDFTRNGKHATTKRDTSGVIVRVKGSTLSAVTDKKGGGQLTVPQGHLLEVSRTGYETRLVKVPREERFSQSVILDKSAGDGQRGPTAQTGQRYSVHRLL